MKNIYSFFGIPYKCNCIWSGMLRLLMKNYWKKSFLSLLQVSSFWFMFRPSFDSFSRLGNFCWFYFQKTLSKNLVKIIKNMKWILKTCDQIDQKLEALWLKIEDINHYARCEDCLWNFIANLLKRFSSCNNKF